MYNKESDEEHDDMATKTVIYWLCAPQYETIHEKSGTEMQDNIMPERENTKNKVAKEKYADSVICECPY